MNAGEGNPPAGPQPRKRSRWWLFAGLMAFVILIVAVGMQSGHPTPKAEEGSAAYSDDVTERRLKAEREESRRRAEEAERAKQEAERRKAEAVAKARGFMDSADNGKNVLAFFHPFADYQRHEYLGYTSGGEGELGLLYKFYWDENQTTEAAFQCDGNGRVHAVTVRSDSGSVAPFAAATLGIRLLGNIVLSDEKNISTENREQLQRLIDSADAKGLLEFWLALMT